MKKRLSVLLILAVILILMPGCGKKADKSSDSPPPKKKITLATASSIKDSGLLDHILPIIEKDLNYKLDVIVVGTGQAISMGEAGEVDVILGHSWLAENKFMEDGFGVDRKGVMYNDFLLIGPEEDPVGIRDGRDITKALKAIAEKEEVFISRGDKSGTHSKELNLWKEAGFIVDLDEEWYIETGQGMADTYRIADEKKGYTLIDRATYLTHQDKNSLIPIIEGDERLFNPYSVICVNPDKFSGINYEGATKFAEWLTSKKGQEIIGEFGKKAYERPLFFPNAK